jgi:hypothetical protein
MTPTSRPRPSLEHVAFEPRPGVHVSGVLDHDAGVGELWWRFDDGTELRDYVVLDSDDDEPEP